MKTPGAGPDRTWSITRGFPPGEPVRATNALRKGGATSERAVALLSQEIDDDFAVNLLTLAEILVAPTRTGQCGTVLRALGDLGVETLQFPADAAVTLAELHAQTLLKMPDCCVLLSALDRRARLASFDDRVVKAAQARDVEVVAG